MKNNGAQNHSEKPSVSRDRDNVIDLRGGAKLTEASVSATLGAIASERPHVASTRVGMDAYHKKKQIEHWPSRQANHPQHAYGTHLADVPVLRTEASIKRVKLSVLKALHAQSNAGSVNIREVSAALDEILRKN